MMMMIVAETAVSRVGGAFKSMQQEFRGLRVGRTLGIDRRMTPRVRCYDLVKWTLEKEFMQHRISNMKDISVTGLRFIVTECLKPNTLLRMLINIAEDNIKIPVLAEVRWCNRIGEHTYQAGVRFVEISKRDQLAIRNATLWAKPSEMDF